MLLGGRLQGSGRPGQGAARRRLPRAARVSAWILGAALVAYCGAQVALRLACDRGALRGRIVDALAARLGPVELGPDVDVDPLFRLRFGPLTVPGARPTDPPLLRVASVRVRPDPWQLLRAGRPVAASVVLDGVHLELPATPAGWQALAARFSARRPGPRAAPSAGGAAGLPTVRLEGLEVAFAVHGRRSTAGPLRATVVPGHGADGTPTASVRLELPGDGRAVADLRREGGGWRATARLDGLDPRALPAGLPPLAAAWAGGTVAIRLDGTYAPARREAKVQVEVAARALHVGGAMIGPDPLGPFDVAFSGLVEWSGRGRKVHVGQGRLTLPGGAPVRVEADLGLGSGLPLSLRAQADEIDFLATVAALPPALALPEGAPRPTGTFGAHLAVAGPLADPGAWQVDAGLDLSRLRSEARRAPPAALTRPFVQRPEVADGPPRAFLVGPDNPDFVPIDELPRYVVRAVTTCEDAGFFFHSGFDFEELRNAAVEGAQAGKVVRGGSTISQQLAKNLYLTREKTLARKLREALVTVALESTVPKQRLMEIYLNVAEWGPGVWGIGPAARHWFGKDARDLTPREAAFLATVIPNPVRYHYMWSRGWLSEHWQERLDGLLRAMNSQGSLTEDELSAALAQPLTFGRCAAGSEDPAGGVTCRGT